MVHHEKKIIDKLISSMFISIANDNVSGFSYLKYVLLILPLLLLVEYCLSEMI